MSMKCPRNVHGQKSDTRLWSSSSRSRTAASLCLAERDTQTAPDTCIDRHKYPIRGVRLNIEHPQSNYCQDTCAMIHPERTKRVTRVARYGALRFACISSTGAAWMRHIRCSVAVSRAGGGALATFAGFGSVSLIVLCSRFPS